MNPNPILLSMALVFGLQASYAQAQDAGLDGRTDQQMEEGADLVEKGMRLLFEGLLEELQPSLDDMLELGEEIGPKFRELQSLMGQIDDYHAPEMLPNGDILIRRKSPLEKTPLKEGEIEL